jgi:uncharacterized membrane protein
MKFLTKYSKAISSKYLPLVIMLIIFSIAYSVLSIVRHNHYQSFGYDLGIDDQIVWQFSNFRLPITSIDDTPFMLSLTNHVELIYAVIAPIYWIWDDVSMLIIVQVLAMVTSAIPVYLLAQKYKLHKLLCYGITYAYLTFYGVQNALWFDVHSSVFGAALMMWFIYFLDREKIKLSWLFFVLTLISKENFAALLFLISLTYLFINRKKYHFYFMGIALAYLIFIFGFYFPHAIVGGYKYQTKDGLLSDFNPIYLINTSDKRDVWIYSLFSFGFIPLFYPLYLISYVGNLVVYFIFGKGVPGAQGLFLHYRVDLVPLLAFATILTIDKWKNKFKLLNSKYMAIYIILCACIVQYALHLPLSYLAKQWFWYQSPAVANINEVISALPTDASVASQDNITPHLSHRREIFTLWPQHQVFTKNSPCGKKICDWFSWGGEPQYLVVDISNDWDIRHFLGDRQDFIQSINNLEKAGYIKIDKQKGNAILFHVVKNI